MIHPRQARHIMDKVDKQHIPKMWRHLGLTSETHRLPIHQEDFVDMG